MTEREVPGPAGGPDDELPAEVSELLADPALWERPSPASRQAVLDALSEAARTEAPRERPSLRLVARHRRWVAPVAAAAAVVVGLVLLRPAAPDGATGPRAEVALAGPVGALEADVVGAEAGWRIDLDATSLPELEEGETYELLLSTSGGRAASAGTFRSGGPVVLWSGLATIGGRSASVVRRGPDGRASAPVLAGIVPVPS